VTQKPKSEQTLDSRLEEELEKARQYLVGNLLTAMEMTPASYLSASSRTTAPWPPSVQMLTMARDPGGLVHNSFSA
jgi:hypothetical protein